MFSLGKLMITFGPRYTVMPFKPILSNEREMSREESCGLVVATNLLVVST